MLITVKNDCRSTTGRNLRNIMLRVNKSNIDKLTANDLKKQVYQVVPFEDQWKVILANDLINCISDGDVNRKDLADILEYIVT